MLRACFRRVRQSPDERRIGRANARLATALAAAVLIAVKKTRIHHAHWAPTGFRLEQHPWAPRCGRQATRRIIAKTGLIIFDAPKNRPDRRLRQASPPSCCFAHRYGPKRKGQRGSARETCFIRSLDASMGLVASQQIQRRRPMAENDHRRASSPGAPNRCRSGQIHHLFEQGRYNHSVVPHRKARRTKAVRHKRLTRRARQRRILGRGSSGFVIASMSRCLYGAGRRLGRPAQFLAFRRFAQFGFGNAVR